MIPVAFMELAGHFICFDEEAFGLADAAACDRALAALAIPRTDFESIKAAALAMPTKSRM
jgi:hypothetical protein